MYKRQSLVSEFVKHGHHVTIVASNLGQEKTNLRMEGDGEVLRVKTCLLYTSRKPKLDISYNEAKAHTHEILKSACRYRMVSDVPVGVFLSGGYDSSAVTAILQAGQNVALKTFTIGFEDGINEAPYAKEVSRFLGTDHTEYMCTTKEAQDIIPMLPYYYDEPFADSSAIPTTLVSQLARKQVTVALSCLLYTSRCV